VDLRAAEDECRAILVAGSFDDSTTLSRRHRWKPLAFDVHDGLGCVLFVARGKRTGLLMSSMTFDLASSSLRRMRGGGYGRSEGEPHLPDRRPMEPGLQRLASRASRSC